jgi:predicted aspartyl protease/Tfp pilus assembly protein PilF
LEQGASPADFLIMIEGMMCMILAISLFCWLDGLAGVGVGKVCRRTQWARHTIYGLVSLPLLLGAPVYAATKCSLSKLAELPVTINNLRAIVRADINGAEARFELDSGAFYSIISPAAADEFNLKVYPLPFKLYVEGIGGRTEPSAARVKELQLAGIRIPNIEFMVGGNDIGPGLVGLLGQNVLSAFDVEYDLANGIIRFMRPRDCQKADLAYWVTATQPYSVMDIERVRDARFHTVGSALVNGVKVTVMFDTGATSMLSLRAAERAGIKPDGQGVVPAGVTHGIGRGWVKTWLAPVQSFKIGDEEIQHSRLRIGEFTMSDAEMLLGADFFLSHRIYVSNSQHRLYFSYNGGPVFNLTASRPPPQGPATATPDEQPPNKDGDEPADAAGFSQRGSAFAARRDFEHAIADFNRACELDPGNAEYFYQRAMALWATKQSTQARKDLDQALTLKPDHVPALLARAEVHFFSHEDAEAVKDLDAAERSVPKQDALRLHLAHLYERAGLYPAAIGQYDLWIASHREDVLLGNALNGRCWSRALVGSDLKKALDDCNDALRLDSKSSAIFDSRGLVRLRLGQYDKSIADYDASLKLQPKNPWSLYGRGVDRLRKGQTAEGQADIAAATALWSNIAEKFRKLGITP